MSDENKHSEDEKNSKKGGEFRVPPRTWVVWIAIFGGIILLMLLKERQVLSPEQRVKLNKLHEQWERDHKLPSRGDVK